MSKLTDLLAELEKATATLKDKEAAERAASSETTHARNIVSNLQKSIDAEMGKLKDAATWSTEWHSQRSRGHAVKAA